MPEPPSLPLPSVDAKPIELVPSDPLAAIYFPFTSGQLAALADKRVAEGTQVDDDKMPTAEELGFKPENPEIVARGYVQYFEDKQTGEAWQRKAMVYDTNNQRVT